MATSEADNKEMQADFRVSRLYVRCKQFCSQLQAFFFFFFPFYYNNLFTVISRCMKSRGVCARLFFFFNPIQAPEGIPPADIFVIL